MAVHSTAIVDPSATIGADVEIGAYAIVGPEVEIGDGCWIGPHGQIQGPTVLGRENKVYPHAAVGFDPQDLTYGGERTTLEVGDRNVFREFCTINRGTVKGGGVTRIGDDNLFMAYTHVGHDCIVGDRIVFANSATLAGHVEVADDAGISAFSSIHQFCRIGTHAYVGGYSVITQDPLPFVKTVGIKPACYGINRIGLSRKGFSEDEIRNLERAYRHLVRSKLGRDEAVAKIREELGDDRHVLTFVEFVEASERGVIRSLPGRKGGRGG